MTRAPDRQGARAGTIKVALAMQDGLEGRLFDETARRDLERVAKVDWRPVSDFEVPGAEGAITDAHVLLTGWGAPSLSADVLEHAGELRAIVHAGGSVKHHVTQACWDKGIMVSSAAFANAKPVAEYTVAAILMANKRLLSYAGSYRSLRRDVDWHGQFRNVGNYHKRIGIVGASRIGCRVLELLRPFDLDVVIADPYLRSADAADLGAELMPLDDLLATSDIVSLHAPYLPETHHLIGEQRLRLLRDDTTIINTARGGLIDTDALTRTVLNRPINAILDVTLPEVLPPDSPLYDHPRVLLTPHVAGSMGTELIRLGRHAIDEVVRFCNGDAFAYPVNPMTLHRTA